MAMAKAALISFPILPQRFIIKPSNYVVLASKQSLLLAKFRIRCSSNEASSSSSSVETTVTSPEDAAEAEDSDGEGEGSIDVPQELPSLISTLNVERALRGIPITDVDHYGRLGLTRGCSSDQIIDAYQIKIEEVMNRGLGEEELNQELALLKESYTILSTVEERRLYDWSLARSGQPDRYVWPFEVDSTKPPLDDPPQQEPEDVGPTRLVGYFILFWVILSFVFSIALNR
ncbi:NAD(P)H-quinone oxidoreductase subunit U, chloroplastic [Humulus lupulus]|uniref:NAD(P)H-quinone oxidoreductase subunit U, chloroplastic n=1 Tax=Humulus lupulus TaxID=3486 RepID=UPI002B402EF1|nr:NAD(P)H-quinone oxidoreductase subunit U, chloroplastic [Humulus lupulus]